MVVPPSGGSTAELWDEIRRLRADLDRVQASRLVPKAAGIDLNAAGAGSGYYSLGFEPKALFFLMNAATSATVATIGVGMAVADENVDGGKYQIAVGIRVSPGGRFRDNSVNHAALLLGTDSSTPTITLAVDSIDHDGFSYTIAGGNPAALRGVAIGF